MGLWPRWVEFRGELKMPLDTSGYPTLMPSGQPDQSSVAATLQAPHIPVPVAVDPNQTAFGSGLSSVGGALSGAGTAIKNWFASQPDNVPVSAVPGGASLPPSVTPAGGAAPVRPSLALDPSKGVPMGATVQNGFLVPPVRGPQLPTRQTIVSMTPAETAAHILGTVPHSADPIHEIAAHIKDAGTAKFLEGAGASAGMLGGATKPPPAGMDEYIDKLPFNQQMRLIDTYMAHAGKPEADRQYVSAVSDKYRQGIDRINSQVAKYSDAWYAAMQRNHESFMGDLLPVVSPLYEGNPLARAQALLLQQAQPQGQGTPEANQTGHSTDTIR
jgi:hypothetical protein